MRFSKRALSRAASIHGLMFAILSLHTITLGREVHTWKSADGQYSVQAEFLGVDGTPEIISLRTQDGRNIKVPYSKMDPESQGLVRRLAAIKEEKQVEAKLIGDSKAEAYKYFLFLFEADLKARESVSSSEMLDKLTSNTKAMLQDSDAISESLGSFKLSPQLHERTVSAIQQFGNKANKLSSRDFFILVGGIGLAGHDINPAGDMRLQSIGKYDRLLRAADAIVATENKKADLSEREVAEIIDSELKLKKKKLTDYLDKE